jgi:hypothetical protein
MKRRVFLGLFIIALLALSVGSVAQAASLHDLAGLKAVPDTFPLKPLPAVQVSQSGFGDRQNNYAWSMGYFKGDLFVGTGRAVDTFNIMWEQLWKAIDPTVRPPELPDVEHPPFLQDFLAISGGKYSVTNEADLQLWASVGRGEIWRLHAGVWSRVYQSPLVNSFLPKMNPSTVVGPYQAPQTSGFRSMITYTDRAGTPALYATSGGFSFALDQPMLYRTTDGVNWSPVTTPKGMGRESRSMAILNGKLYVGVGGGVSGVTPSVWSTNTPMIASSWKRVLDFAQPGVDNTNLGVKSMCAYNNRLYVGTQNLAGFQVYRSTGGYPAGNSQWKQVIADGAGDRYNANAQTMKVFRGMLYITSLSLPFLTNYDDFKGFEMIRMYPDDRWDLVVGSSDPIDPPDPSVTRTPISGWTAGFGNPMAFYGWSMEVWEGELYVGNLDTTVFLRYLEDYPGELPDIPNLAEMVAAAKLISGCDLWRSADGVNWEPVTINGFRNADNYGFRTMQAVNNGLYLGTANPWTGCEIWKLK